jgi:uncharacterized protein YcbK (DUF882 family)
MAWKYFKLEEFACKCCGENSFDPTLIDLLEDGRERLGVPFVIPSGYRCPKHNAAVSSTGKNGPHTTGRAVDIAIHGYQAFDLIEWALSTGKITGLGIHQRGDMKKRFVHLDTLPRDELRFRPTVWSY